MLRDPDTHGWPLNGDPRRHERLAVICAVLSLAFGLVGAVVLAVAVFAWAA